MDRFCKNFLLHSGSPSHLAHGDVLIFPFGVLSAEDGADAVSGMLRSSPTSASTCPRAPPVSGRRSSAPQHTPTRPSTPPAPPLTVHAPAAARAPARSPPQSRHQLADAPLATVLAGTRSSARRSAPRNSLPPPDAHEPPCATAPATPAFTPASYASAPTELPALLRPLAPLLFKPPQPSTETHTTSSPPQLTPLVQLLLDEHRSAGDGYALAVSAVDTFFASDAPFVD